MNKVILISLLLIANISNANAQINIDTASFYSVFEKLNFDNENIVVIGEAHNISNTYNAEFFIIEKLAEKGYKTLYIEGGESEAAIMTMFLQTGDSTLLNYTRGRESSGTYKKFLRSIYKLNNEKEYGLTFKGFDFERPTCVGYLFSKWLGDAKIENIDFKKLTDYIISIDQMESKNLNDVIKKNFKLKVVLDSLKTSYAQHEDQYKKNLKDNFITFKKIVYSPTSADFSTRDANFTKTMLQMDKEGSLNKSIIITGNGHVLHRKKFIPLLSDSLPEKYSINSFILIYSNCENLESDKKYSSKGKFVKCLPKIKEDKALINFSRSEQIIPSNKKNIVTTLVGMYNQ